MTASSLPNRIIAGRLSDWPKWPNRFLGIGISCAAILTCLMLARSLGADRSELPPFEEEPLASAIRQAIIAELKDKYEDDKNWGHTTPALRGIRLRGQGLRLHWETRTKQVNDGLWKRYVVTMVEPERQLHVGLDHLHLNDAGRLTFTLRLAATLHGEARIEQWERGIKLLGTSAAGDATVAATIDCDVGIRFESGKLANDVLLDPHVAAIHLELVDLDVRRISKLGGKAAHELGDSFTPMVARQLKRREAKLVEKANASIEKHRDVLRLPVDQFVASGWAKIQSLLPLVAPSAAAPMDSSPTSATPTSPASMEPASQ
jgi:hypothetical protein